MKFTHVNGEDAAGRRVSVAPHLKPEVGEDGTFEVSESKLKERGVDPEASRERLEEAGHRYGVPEPVTDEDSVDEDEDGESPDHDEEDSGSGEDESQDEPESDESPEDEEDSGSGEDQKPEGATKTDLMNLYKDQLVEMAEEVEGVETDQNKEPLAEDLAGQVVLEDEE